MVPLDEVGYLDATTIRLKAVDELANKASEHYRIDPSFRTLAKGERPGPVPGQLGIMQRWEQVEEDRWLVQCLVAPGWLGRSKGDWQTTSSSPTSAGSLWSHRRSERGHGSIACLSRLTCRP
jgi:hypothetical protein